MIDIYNELGFIKNVLSDGLSSKWMRDARLLVRYYKIEGLSKKQAKEKIKEKCLHAASLGIITYDPYINFKDVNTIVDKAWKDTHPLREITKIETSKEVVDWFLSLETSYSISDEEVLQIKSKRPKIVIKHNHPVNWERTKYLWTLYIWTLIQQNYTPEDTKSDIFYFKNKSTTKRFREDANLKQSFSMKADRNLLYDLGLISINFSLGITPVFMKNFDVFKIPITDENRVVITTGEPPYGDLYNPGLWLEKQKFGTFTCQICGKEFAHYNLTPREKARKYCKECAKDLKKQKAHPEVYIDNDKLHRWCVDCGTMFDVPEGNTNSIRCPECQEKYRRQYKAEKQKEYRDNIVFLD